MKSILDNYIMHLTDDIKTTGSKLLFSHLVPFITVFIFYDSVI